MKPVNSAPMPSSWTQNFYHAVFSTKKRVETISPKVEERLYPFMGGILKDLRAVPIAINGTADHVHVLTRYPPDLAHADMLLHIKKRSSEWIHDTFEGMGGFAWQKGYGGFTVSKSGVDKAADYIRRQKEHHSSVSSLEEFKELLRLHDIEYDAEYLD